jgi:transposase
LEQQYQTMESRWEKDAPLPDLAIAKGEAKSKNAMTLNARAQIARVIGVDLECFPTVKQFCSWLGLAPHNDIAGRKVLRSRTMKVHSRANQAFGQAAHSVTRAHSSIGA